VRFVIFSHNGAMRLKFINRNLVALFFGLLLIVLIECAMALFQVLPLAEQDPFVGFSETSPLFVEESSGNFIVNPAKSAYFNTPQSFSMPKPVGVFRIVVFGGSTTYGRPYRHQTSFGAWLERLIEHYSANVNVEVINAGGISYASYRVRRLMTEMSAYDPDLFIVYTGHNEFLEARTFAALREQPEVIRKLRSFAHHSRLYSSLARILGKVASPGDRLTTFGDKVDATLERIGGPELYHRDPSFRQGVIRQYQHEIEAMVRFCQKREIPLILSTLPVNLSGIAPFKSEHAAGLDSAALMAWQTAFESGLAALADKRPQQALNAFAEADALDSGYAELHYRKGQAYWQLGQAHQAYLSFDRARQEDIVPLRALNEFNTLLRSVAAAEQVALADVEKTFLKISPGNIPGENLFVDHVHPSLEGQQLVAWIILNAATDAGLLPLDAATWQKVMPQAREFLRQGLTAVPEDYKAQGLWSVGRLFFWAGKYSEAYVALRQAWQTIKDQAEMARQLGELELVRGDIAAALFYLNAAERLAPGDLKVALARAAALNRVGRSDEALSLLQTLTLPDNDQAAGVYHLMGETLLLLDRPAEAATNYRRAVETAPQVAAYRLALAEAYKDAGNAAAAESAYRGYLEQLPNRAVAVPIEQWQRQP